MAVKYKRETPEAAPRRGMPGVPPRNRVGFALMGFAIVLVFVMTSGKMTLWPATMRGTALLLEKTPITLASGNKVYMLTLRVNIGNNRTATGRWRVNDGPATAFKVGDTVSVLYEWSFRSAEIRILECSPVAPPKPNP